MLPGTRPMLLETFAMTGGYPSASKVGNVTSDPEPTTAFMVPAARPAAKIKMTSTAPRCTSLLPWRVHDGHATRRRETHSNRWPRIPAPDDAADGRTGMRADPGHAGACGAHAP